jgi:hypothetical protein
MEKEIRYKTESKKEMRYLLFILIIIISFNWTSVTFSEKKETQLVGIIIASCLSLDVIKEIAKKDTISNTAAVTLFKKYSLMGVCGRYPTPRLVPLEKLEDEYVDYNNKKSQIWKLKDLNMWSIVDPKRIEDIPLKRNTLKTKTGQEI